MQFTSGWATSTSSTLARARVWSISSPRTSIDLEAGTGDGFVVALDALLGIVGAGQTDEADALACLPAIAVFISSPAFLPSSTLDEPI